jgi:hypothetical protein
MRSAQPGGYTRAERRQRRAGWRAADTGADDDTPGYRSRRAGPAGPPAEGTWSPLPERRARQPATADLDTRRPSLFAQNASSYPAATYPRMNQREAALTSAVSVATYQSVHRIKASSPSL